MKFALYRIVLRDNDGKPLDGAATYRLSVPPNPACQAILVGRAVRLRYPCAHIKHAAREPVVTDV